MIVEGVLVLLEDRIIERNPPETARFVTHLPVFDLQLVSRWGVRVYEHVVDELGWVRLLMPPGRRLPRQWFVARIEGHGVDDGTSGFCDGALAVFDGKPQDTQAGVPFLIRGSFFDPELGAYTVRTILRLRDGRIALIALNPDRSRFPVIVVDADDFDRVRVVARLLIRAEDAGSRG